MNVRDLVVEIKIPDGWNELQEGLEIASDRITMHRHAELCARLVWPYWRPVSRPRLQEIARSVLGVGV